MSNEDRTVQVYFSTVVETTCPIPEDPYQMIGLSSVALNEDFEILQAFWGYFPSENVSIHPLSSRYWETERDYLESMRREMEPTDECVIKSFRGFILNTCKQWAETISPQGGISCRPILLAYQAPYVYSWLVKYFWKYPDKSVVPEEASTIASVVPFGLNAIDLKSIISAKYNSDYIRTSKGVVIKGSEEDGNLEVCKKFDSSFDRIKFIPKILRKALKQGLIARHILGKESKNEEVAAVGISSKGSN